MGIGHIRNFFSSRTLLTWSVAFSVTLFLSALVAAIASGDGAKQIGSKLVSGDEGHTNEERRASYERIDDLDSGISAKTSLTQRVDLLVTVIDDPSQPTDLRLYAVGMLRRQGKPGLGRLFDYFAVAADEAISYQAFVELLQCQPDDLSSIEERIVEYIQDSDREHAGRGIAVLLRMGAMARPALERLLQLQGFQYTDKVRIALDSIPQGEGPRENGDTH
jgi:hypothetical protein